MLKKSLFKKPNILPEVFSKSGPSVVPSVPDEMWTTCPECKKAVLSGDLLDNLNVCPSCGHHSMVNARQRIDYLCDSGSFEEHDGGKTSANLIDFPDYDRKLKSALLASGELEAVITGTGTVNGARCAVFAMEPRFMMGSMGTVVGEKITALFEYATAAGLPVVGFCVSGGARMQEGILSLMQMAKTSGAVKRHSDGGGLYIAILTDPTTGGVTASFAMEADIIIAEPGALIGFAGPRVIEQTIRQKLPAGFQRAEFLLEKGFVDMVSTRKEHRETVSHLLALHAPAEKGGV